MAQKRRLMIIYNQLIDSVHTCVPGNWTSYFVQSQNRRENRIGETVGPHSFSLAHEQSDMETGNDFWWKSFRNVLAKSCVDTLAKDDDLQCLEIPMRIILCCVSACARMCLCARACARRASTNCRLSKPGRR